MGEPNSIIPKDSLVKITNNKFSIIAEVIENVDHFDGKELEPGQQDLWADLVAAVFSWYNVVYDDESDTYEGKELDVALNKLEAVFRLIINVP